VLLSHAPQLLCRTPGQERAVAAPQRFLNQQSACKPGGSVDHPIGLIHFPRLSFMVENLCILEIHFALKFIIALVEKFVYNDYVG
jgi:hypothetical protein